VPASYLKTPGFGLPLLRAIQRDPLGVAQQFRRSHGDIVGMTILFQKIHYLFGPDAARQVLALHHEHFTKEARQLRIFRSTQGVNVLTTEGADWQRQRRILMPQFMPKKLSAYLALMSAATDAGIREQLPSGPGEAHLLDVDRFTTRLTMDVILRTLFSYCASREESDTVSRVIRALAAQSMRELFWLFVPPDWLPYPGRRAKITNRSHLHDLIARQIRLRRAQSRGSDAAADRPADLLEMLLTARDDSTPAAVATDALSDQEIHDNCVVIFLAGHDTSATALTWWLGLMAAHPHIAAQVRDEVATGDAPVRLPLLNATLKEALRLYPPATGTFSRVAQRILRVGDVDIPKGAIVAIPIWNIQHDERWFDDPESFRPERFLPGAPDIVRGAYLPFGAGPHFCLGQHFATAELALIAARLILQYDVALEPGQGLPTPEVDLALKPSRRLFVKFTRRFDYNAGPAEPADRSP
jgi:cytochrome P450